MRYLLHTMQSDVRVHWISVAMRANALKRIQQSCGGLCMCECVSYCDSTEYFSRNEWRKKNDVTLPPAPMAHFHQANTYISVQFSFARATLCLHARYVDFFQSGDALRASIQSSHATFSFLSSLLVRKIKPIYLCRSRRDSIRCALFDVALLQASIILDFW